MTANEPQETGIEVVDAEIIHPGDTDYFDESKALLEFAKARVTLLKEVLQMSLQNTNEHDWVLMRGRAGEPPMPYLQSSGAEKIARLFGVKVSGVRATKYLTEPNEQGIRAYIWEYTGEFSIRSSNDSIECPGSRSSADEFFTKQRNFDERDVKMAAYSNMYVNGVTRLLGLRNISLQQLTLAGLKQDRMRGVDYKSKDARPAQIQEPVEPQEPNALRKLYDLICQVVGKEETQVADFLESITEFVSTSTGEIVPGVRSLKSLSASPKRVEVTLGQLRKGIESGKYKIKFNPDGSLI